ncbi:DUF1674 domain-containing protein [Novosphingobium sp. 9]|uniref:DUF1674 domain-containing protein n=1 Tax=Novosphingobium sp. 9 TaxID=2025349 RepID=UPI0021B6792A|nr:DUF1674 domain-containing protein [Novosphingobium sp. 9]
MGQMTERATSRSTSRPSDGFVKPAHWTTEPAPAPQTGSAVAPTSDEDPDGLSPTRYGDWVRNGIAVDF